ncbi:DUF397 domain-containing protein [Streptomyces collinus]|uniref:DUF397 domain-containing protein n=1 Tax=Streptomyces collinus TaxID=42684 RepID=UPI0037B3D323
MNRILGPGIAVWRKSSYSDGGRRTVPRSPTTGPGMVPVRDSKLPRSPILAFGAGSWGVFPAGVKTERPSRTRG